MNTKLLYSTIFTALLLLFIILSRYNDSYHMLYFFVFLGVVTSLINHGYSSKYYVYADRFVIAVNVLVFLYYISKIENIHLRATGYCLILLGILSYVISKNISYGESRNIFHIISHINVALLIIILHM
jgi:hypothetical protein